MNISATAPAHQIHGAANQPESTAGKFPILAAFRSVQTKNLRLSCPKEFTPSERTVRFPLAPLLKRYTTLNLRLASTIDALAPVT